MNEPVLWWQLLIAGPILGIGWNVGRTAIMLMRDGWRPWRLDHWRAILGGGR